MELKTVVEKAKKQLADLTGFTSPVGTGVKKEKEGWLVAIEVTEKKSIPEGMDILGAYDVHLDAKGDLISYRRKALRKRTDTDDVCSEES